MAGRNALRNRVLVYRFLSRILGPRTTRFPSSDQGDSDVGTQRIECIRLFSVDLQALDGGVVDQSGHRFGGRVLSLERNDSVAVALPKFIEGGILGVHAHRVIERIEKLSERLFDDLEVANHVVGIEAIGFEHDLDSAGMAMRKLTFVRVLGQHVAAFDVDGFTDAVGHGSMVLGAAGIAEQVDLQTRTESVAAFFAKVD